VTESIVTESIVTESPVTESPVPESPVPQSIVTCPFCAVEMEAGYVWVAHIFAGGLCWQQSKPKLAFWKPSPGQSVLQSHMFNESRSLRPAFRCTKCESVTIQPKGVV